MRAIVLLPKAFLSFGPNILFIGIDLGTGIPLAEHCFQVLGIMDFGGIGNPGPNELVLAIQAHGEFVAMM